ncbi:MAG: hypothetical protein QOF35_1112 [Actinomycetota bacterium]|nr:hypothetical protein [Actinomycetota bacterium]
MYLPFPQRAMVCLPFPRRATVYLRFPRRATVHLPFAQRRHHGRSPSTRLAMFPQRPIPVDRLRCLRDTPTWAG